MTHVMILDGTERVYVYNEDFIVYKPDLLYIL